MFIVDINCRKQHLQFINIKLTSIIWKMKAELDQARVIDVLDKAAFDDNKE